MAASQKSNFIGLFTHEQNGEQRADYGKQQLQQIMPEPSAMIPASNHLVKKHILQPGIF
jgi:hypothetical protein